VRRLGQIQPVAGRRVPFLLPGIAAVSGDIGELWVTGRLLRQLRARDPASPACTGRGGDPRRQILWRFPPAPHHHTRVCTTPHTAHRTRLCTTGARVCATRDTTHPYSCVCTTRDTTHKAQHRCSCVCTTPDTSHTRHTTGAVSARLPAGGVQPPGRRPLARGAASTGGWLRALPPLGILSEGPPAQTLVGFGVVAPACLKPRQGGGLPARCRPRCCCEGWAFEAVAVVPTAVLLVLFGHCV